MESRGAKIFAGFLLGAIAGYLVGDLIAYYVAPEYYTEEELEELENYKNLYGDPAAKEPQDHIHVGVTSHQPTEEEKNMRKVNYSSYFGDGEEKPPVEELVAKYNDPEYVEPDEDEDDEFEDLEDVETDVPLNDLDTLLENRDENDIYIMTPEEYAENASGFKQITLNYYNQDDVLTYENDQPLESGRVEKVIGDAALLSFGLYSDDPSVVYVCNPHLKGEYEIILQEEVSYEEKMTGTIPAQIKPKVVHNAFEDYEEPSVEEFGEEEDVPRS